MRIINTKADFNYEKCIGCTLCSKVCPTDAIRFENKMPVLQNQYCVGCASCVDHCPEEAVNLQPLDEIRTIFCNPDDFNSEEIEKLCLAAHYYPKQNICACTGTSAGEVAAAILAGAKNPIDLARMTGVRTGCKCLCAEGPLRMLEAAGIDPGEAPGYQWYMMTPTLWSLDEEVKKEHDGKFHFTDDLKFCEDCLKKGLERE